MKLYKFKPKNREEFSKFQKHFFNLGFKIHSQRDSEVLSEINFNICDAIPRYKGTKLDYDIYGICLFKDEIGYYMQCVDSLNYNLSEKEEFNINSI